MTTMNDETLTVAPPLRSEYEDLNLQLHATTNISNPGAFGIIGDTTFVADEYNAGIVESDLSRNGYAKFANGLIVQWGTSNATNRDTEVKFPVAFGVLFSVIGCPKSSSNLTGSQNNFGVKSQNNTGFIANMYDNGRGYAGFNWCAFGRA